MAATGANRADRDEAQPRRPHPRQETPICYLPRPHRGRPPGDRPAIRRFHASHGQAEPAGEHLLSEPKIVAELAKAILPPNPKVDWDAWSGNYALVRDAIADTYPAIFLTSTSASKIPPALIVPCPRASAGGLRQMARPTSFSGSLSENPDLPRTRVGVLTLMTLQKQ